MEHAIPPLRPLAAERAPWLRGRLAVPGDVPTARLALILGAMAQGETVIEGVPESAELDETAQALRALGARVAGGGGSWQVRGLAGMWLEPEAPLQFSSPAAAASLMGLLALVPFATRFTGDAALSARPLPALLSVLRASGCDVRAQDGDRLPLTLCGPPTPLPVLCRAPAAAAAKQALLLAGLAVPGTSRVLAPLALPDNAERLLAAFGARLSVAVAEEGVEAIEVEGLPALAALRVPVPADPALAGFAMVAATLVPGSELVLADVAIAPRQAELLSALGRMGADISVLQSRATPAGALAELVVRHARLAGISLPADTVAALGPGWVALAVAAAYAEGATVLGGRARLEAHEGARVAAVLEGLRRNGVPWHAEGDALVIGGSGRVPGGGRVATLLDPIVAMGALVLGMVAEDAVTIDDRSPLAAAFPDFVARFEAVGASFIHYTD